MIPYACTCSCSSLLHVFLTLGGLEGLEDSRFWLKVWVQAYFNSLCMLLLCFCRYVLRSSRRGLGIRIEYARQTMGALSFHRSPTGSLRSTSTPHSDSSSTYSSWRPTVDRFLTHSNDLHTLPWISFFCHFFTLSRTARFPAFECMYIKSIIYAICDSLSSEHFDIIFSWRGVHSYRWMSLKDSYRWMSLKDSYRWMSLKDSYSYGLPIMMW
jgi:hypothetical protein